MHIKKILVPIDLSSSTQLQLDFASSLARQYGAAVSLVHVHESPHHFAGGSFVDAPAPDTSQIAAEFKQVRLPESSTPAEHVLLAGNPADEVVRLADEGQYDLLILGSHGRTGLARVLMGSIAESIVRRVRCPVIVCKPCSDVLK